jgi:hypothetical protein
MKYTIYAALALITLLIAVPATEIMADIRCRTDSFGNTTCRDDYGNTWRGRKDSFGNKTYRDDSGNTMRGRTDSFGNQTWRDDQGNTIRGRTDSLGTRPTETIKATPFGAARTHSETRRVDSVSQQVVGADTLQCAFLTRRSHYRFRKAHCNAPLDSALCPIGEKYAILEN